MSNDEFKVIEVVSKTLKKLLDTNLTNIYTSLPPNFEPVSLLSPKNITKDDRLSLFLYRITENAFMKNQPMARPASGQPSNKLNYPPLSLNLHYLLIPYNETNTQDAGSMQAILGKAMQVFYDNASLEGADLLDALKGAGFGDFYDNIEQVRIILESLSLEDLTKIFGAIEAPLRVSAAYEVRVIMIESEREKKIERIREKTTGYYQA